MKHFLFVTATAATAATLQQPHQFVLLLFHSFLGKHWCIFSRSDRIVHCWSMLKRSQASTHTHRWMQQVFPLAHRFNFMSTQCVSHTHTQNAFGSIWYAFIENTTYIPNEKGNKPEKRKSRQSALTHACAPNKKSKWKEWLNNRPRMMKFLFSAAASSYSLCCISLHS